MIKKYIIDKIASRLGIPTSAMAYWHAFNKVAGHLSIGLPDVLMALGANNMLRGFLNRFVIPINLDWVWPYWVVQQFDPMSPSFVARGFQITTLNMTNRNWTAIGAINSVKEAVVDQRGLVVPQINGWSVDSWILYKGELYAPSKMPGVTQYPCQDLPIVITEFKVGELTINCEAFVEKVNKEDMIFHRAKIVNGGTQKEKLSFIYSIRPYNIEGLSLIGSIEYKENIFYVNDRVGVYLPAVPDQVLCNTYEQGDVSLFLNKEIKQNLSTKCPIGFATAMAKYDLELESKDTKEVIAYIPIEKKLSFKGLDKLDYEQVITDTIAGWRDRLDNRGMHIQVPDARLQAAFLANRAYMLVFHDGDSITPGPFSYHFFWYRDAAYMINALDKMGFSEEAGQILYTYPKLQKKGHFSSQKGEWDSNGQAIWTMVEHYRFSNDKAYLNKVYPSIVGAMKWIRNNRPISKNPLYSGLHRPGLSAEHFGSNDYYYWDDFWSLAGLREGVRMAEVMGKKGDADLYRKVHAELMASVDRSLLEVAKRFDKPIIPISPSLSRRMDSAA
ncbi:MAG: hypothetical protein WC838_04795, partial [Candidatus Margulisiibacteriota bacterium]